jgi:hypothetical protein
LRFAEERLNLMGEVMKMFVKLTFLSALLVVLFGCASSGSYETHLPPPEDMNPVFMRYKELPGQKVFVVAVDPNGRWAFGYDNGRATLTEAAQTAAIKCDQARKKFNILTKAQLFAINDEVVYYNHK